MPLAVKITSIKADGQQLRVAFTLTASGNYTTAVGGDTIDFTAATADPAFIGMLAQIISSQPPIQLDVWDQSGNLANGFFPVVGSALNNSKLKIASAFNTELGTGAYPAAIATTGKLVGEAIFQKLL